jgi:hypothetical protein
MFEAASGSSSALPTGGDAVRKWARAIHLGQSYPALELGPDAPADLLGYEGRVKSWIESRESGRETASSAVARELHRRARVVPDPARVRSASRPEHLPRAGACSEVSQ